MVRSRQRHVDHALAGCHACLCVIVRMADEFGPFGIADAGDHRRTVGDVAYWTEARGFFLRQLQLDVQPARTDGLEIEEAADGQRVPDCRMSAMHGCEM